MKLSTTLLVLSLAAASCAVDTRSATLPPPPAASAPATTALSELVLRSYEVPNDGAAQMRSVLKDVMWFGSGGQDNKGQFVGRADVSPDGRLLVLASAGVQEGVRGLIEQMSKNPGKARSTIEISYWLVEGTPSTAKENPRPASLTEVSPALAEIEKADGPQQFKLQEKVAVRSLTGEYAAVDGRQWRVGQTASVLSSGVSAEIKINTHGPQHLDTRVKLQPGQIAVLGSSGAGEKDKDSVGSLYYLIRAAIHDGQGQ